MIETRGKLDLDIMISDISFFITVSVSVSTHFMMPEHGIHGLKETRVSLSPIWPQQWRGNAKQDIRCTALIFQKRAPAYDLCLPILIALHRIQNFSYVMFSGI